MARIDFFLDEDEGIFYFNEANTIPGFTAISQFPKLWQYEGLSEKMILDHLIEAAFERHERKMSHIKQKI